MSYNVSHIPAASEKTNDFVLLPCRLRTEDEDLDYSFLEERGMHILAPRIPQRIYHFSDT